MMKALSLNEIRSRAARFAADWRDEPGEEEQQAQDFVRELLAIYGVSERRARTFERKVKRTSTGGRGRIDALVPGVALIEMKSAGRSLIAAENQARDYLDSLTDAEMPQWIILSDFKKFRLVDLDKPAGEQATEFLLKDLRDRAEALRFLDRNLQRRSYTPKEQEEASIKAARIMAGLYESLAKSGYDDHEASVFLVRTLFALYADDAGIWDEDLFLEFLETRTSEDGSDLGAQLTSLYQTLARPKELRQNNLDELVAQFPYVNGGVFNNPTSIPFFDSEARDRLLAACDFNWSRISPAVFGSLFQAVKDKAARRELGEHYTTETNILKVIGPMFLDELNRQFEDSKDSASSLRKMRKAMGVMKFLDPACGCGNFLVIAYREMRALDLRILLRLQELEAGGRGRQAINKARGVHRPTESAFLPTLMFGDEIDSGDLPVRLENFHGIELEEWPARIAATALHLVEHQANLAMELALGVGPETLPLNKVDTIHDGNALELDWTGVVGPTTQLFVLGNPPFVGYDQRTDSQKRELQRIWRTERIGRLDYVTAWHAKCMELFSKPGYDGQFAFVSTNSITQGEPVPLLFGPLFGAGWRISFAHRTFRWTSEAPEQAQVHCVIVGFRRATSRPHPARLFEYETKKGKITERRVPNINAYLIDAENIIAYKRTKPLSPSLPPVINGSVAGDTAKGEENLGGLILSTEQMESIKATDPVAAKYLRPYVGGQDFLNGKIRWCLWLEGWDSTDLHHSPELRRRLENVKNVRRNSTELSTRRLADTPYLFKHNAQPKTRYVCIPRTVSVNRPYLAVGYLEPDYIVSNGSFWAADPDGLVFAIASSGMFMSWQKAIGGRLKSDPRFANTMVWNNFPMPAVGEQLREQIIRAGKGVLDARALRPDRSLSDHYNPLGMDASLLKAHRVLDAAVHRAFGLAGEVTEEARIKALFAAHSRMTAAETLPIAKVGRTKRLQR